MPKWHCDVCKADNFDTYDEVLEHDRICRVVNIRYEEGKELGFDLDVCDVKDGQMVYISPKSVIYTLARYINASVAKELLCLNSWDDMDDACLHNLRAFGRNNIPLESRDLMEVINGDSLKAILTGKITPVLLISTVAKFQYHKNNDIVCLDYNLSSAEDLTNVLLCRESYPIKLTLQRCGARIKQTARKSGSMNDISKLDLSNNNLVESIGWDRLLEGLSKIDQVTEIDLSNNNIGRDGCIALASLLERDSSSLTKLCLKHNQIDDECITSLASGLSDNTTLITLDISNNIGITKAGWKCLLDLVYDTTSINRTYHSNHTLQDVGDIEKILNGEVEGGGWDTLDMLSIRDSLKVNKRQIRSNMPQNPARYKLWETYFGWGIVDLRPFLEMDVQVIQYVLAWFANDIDRIERWCRTAIYYFIRNWDVPVLFGYPSAESLRMGKRLEELEKLVERMRIENRQVHELKEENEELKAEIQALKGGTGDSNSVDGQEKLKRRRNA